MGNDKNRDDTFSNRLKKKFTLKEVSASFGDYGTLIPYVIGYVSIVGLNPASIFFCLGFTNIVLGIKYSIPLPIQPQKTIGAVAISNNWTTSQVISTGFATGVIWSFVSLSRKFDKVVDKIPKIVGRAIQMSLAFILGWMAFNLILDNLLLSLFSATIILLSIKYKKIPAAIILTILGIILIIEQGIFQTISISLNRPDFTFYMISWSDLVWGMIHAGFAQLILTFANAIVATLAMTNDLFPNQKKPITANTLSSNHGIINLSVPFLGGFPLCHGSGGLASKYLFGSRTGGSLIFEGLIEITFGLFFSNLLLIIFNNFPQSIFGVMLFYTAILLSQVSLNGAKNTEIIIILISAIASFIWNITIGFIIAILLHFCISKYNSKKDIATKNI